MAISAGLCAMGSICNEVYLHRMYEYSLIYIYANGTGTAVGVAVQFVCSLHAFHPLGLLCGLHTFFSPLICTVLAAAKAAQSFSESGPESLSICLWRELHC